MIKQLTLFLISIIALWLLLAYLPTTAGSSEIGRPFYQPPDTAIPLSPFAGQNVVTVTTVAELESAVSQANSQGGNMTIRIADGTYTLNDTLYINAPNVILTSVSGIRENVIIEGDAMSGSASVGNVVRIAAANVQITNLTLQKSRWHLIQVAGETNADHFVASNVIFRDAYEQMLKVSYNPADPTTSADYGLVENSLFEYTAGIGPQYYIGGIDAHQAHNWIVRNNIFKDIASPDTAVAEHAVHFWSNSSGTIVENNVIIDSDRGIGFGLTAGRGHSGGIIRNNMIYHSDNADPFADTGIALWHSHDTLVVNNTVVLDHNFSWAIEYRFPDTTNISIVNNLTNKPIQKRDGAAGTIENNVTTAEPGWFVNVTQGDLHLVDHLTTRTSVIDQGVALAEVTADIDGDSRPQGSAYDIGADEVAGPTATLTADPAAITQGQSSTLTWSASDATSCTGSGFNTGGAPSGSVIVTPASTTTYAIACEGAADSATVSVMTHFLMLPAITKP